MSREYDHRWTYFGVGNPPKEEGTRPLTVAYCDSQPYVLCDLNLHGGDERDEILEAFVGEVWSRQIRGDKRLVCDKEPA